MINKRYTILFAFALWMIVGISQMFASNVNQISHINGKGVKIKKSGIYLFTNDIKVDLKNGRAAITIDANNVIIDLNQFTLQQKGSGQNNIGVLVKPGHQSITIRNGTIGNIHGFGIQFKEDNHIINLENLTVKSSGSNGSVFLFQDNVPHTGGILFLGTNSLPVTDIILRHVYAVNNRTFDPQVALNGLLIAEADKVTIQDCHFSDNEGISEIAVVGAEFFHTSNCVIENSHADNNSNHPFDGTNAGCFGFHFNSVSSIGVLDSTEFSNIKVANTTANRTTGNVVRMAGFRFRQVRNLTVEDSESHQTINTLADPVNVDPTITATAGFIMTVCDNFTISNCRAYEHLTLHPSQRIVAGIDVARSNFGLITNCHAARCQNTGNGVFGGFVIEPALDRPNFTRSVGIIFENSISEGNLGSSQGGGFAFLRADEGKIIDCEAIANTPFGIQVGSTSLNDSINSIIKNNIVMSNGSVGIIDNKATAAATNNAYLSNIGRDQPTNFILPPGNPIVIWPLSTGGPLVSNDLNNIDIR